MNSAVKQKLLEQRFIESLESLSERDERPALAALRRGLGKRPGEAMEMHRYVVPFIHGLQRWQEDAYYIVAALFGLFPTESWQPRHEYEQTNLGASLAQLAKEQPDSASIERRFIALLNCNLEDLADHLRHTIGLLKSKEIPVDWLRLLRDIKSWDRDDRWVQRSWSRAFWSTTLDDDTAKAGTSTAAEEDNPLSKTDTMGG